MVQAAFTVITYLYSLSCPPPQKKKRDMILTPSLFPRSLLPICPDFSVPCAACLPVLRSVTHFPSSCVSEGEWDKEGRRERESRNWRWWRKSVRCTEHESKTLSPNECFFLQLGAGCLLFSLFLTLYCTSHSRSNFLVVSLSLFLTSEEDNIMSAYLFIFSPYPYLDSFSLSCLW